MAKKVKAGKGKKAVTVDIQYQIKVTGSEAQHPKTYEYATEGELSLARANEKDPYKREILLLKFLVKQFKEHARVQRKALLAKRHAAGRKSGKKA